MKPAPSFHLLLHLFHHPSLSCFQPPESFFVEKGQVAGTPLCVFPYILAPRHCPPPHPPPPPPHPPPPPPLFPRLIPPPPDSLWRPQHDVCVGGGGVRGGRHHPAVQPHPCLPRTLHQHLPGAAGTRVGEGGGVEELELSSLKEVVAKEPFGKDLLWPDATPHGNFNAVGAL